MQDKNYLFAITRIVLTVKNRLWGFVDGLFRLLIRLVLAPLQETDNAEKFGEMRRRFLKTA